MQRDHPARRLPALRFRGLALCRRAVLALLACRQGRCSPAGTGGRDAGSTPAVGRRHQGHAERQQRRHMVAQPSSLGASPPARHRRGGAQARGSRRPASFEDGGVHPGLARSTRCAPPPRRAPCHLPALAGREARCCGGLGSAAHHPGLRTLARDPTSSPASRARRRDAQQLPAGQAIHDRGDRISCLAHRQG
jgi:hypothetical protein